MAEKFLQKANAEMERKGTKGLFTRKAKAAGKSVQEFAREKSGAKGKLGKEARFARTMGKMHGGRHGG